MMYMKETVDIAKKTFNEYDKNKDGVLSISELKPLLERIANLLKLPQASDKDIENGMKRLDYNNNKVLEFDEFFRFFKEVYPNLPDNL